MLFLGFRIGADRYVVEAAHVVAVLPLVELKAIPAAPRGVAGLLNYHGRAVPVIDVAAEALGTPARRHLHTRILIVRDAGESGEAPLLGLIVEHASGTLRRDVSAFGDPGVTGARYLGPVMSDDDGLVQWVRPQRLLSDEVRAALHRECEALR